MGRRTKEKCKCYVCRKVVFMFIVRPFPLGLSRSRSLGAKMPCHFMGQPSEIKENQINRHAQAEVNYFGFFSLLAVSAFVHFKSIFEPRLSPRELCVCSTSTFVERILRIQYEYICWPWIQTGESVKSFPRSRLTIRISIHCFITFSMAWTRCVIGYMRMMCRCSGLSLKGTRSLPNRYWI